MTVNKDSIEIKIDGETLSFKLTASQKAQLKRATKKVVEDTAPSPLFGGLTLCCKSPKTSAFPLVIMHSGKITSTWKLKGFTGNKSAYSGRDFNLTELKAFIRQLKEYAAKVWPKSDIKSV